MTQGRQSRRAKTAFGLVAALLCALALTPAGALAAGDCEYCVQIPGGDGNGQDPTANASGGSGGGSSDASVDDAGTATTPTTDTGATSDSSDDSDDGSGSAAGGGGKGGDGDQAPAANGGERSKDSLAPATGAVQSSDSDDGGFPVILVAIAIVAAAGVGFAAWRVRRGGDGVGRPAQSGHSA